MGKKAFLIFTFFSKFTFAYENRRGIFPLVSSLTFSISLSQFYTRGCSCPVFHAHTSCCNPLYYLSLFPAGPPHQCGDVDLCHLSWATTPLFEILFPVWFWEDTVQERSGSWSRHSWALKVAVGCEVLCQLPWLLAGTAPRPAAPCLRSRPVARWHLCCTLASVLCCTASVKFPHSLKGGGGENKFGPITSLHCPLSASYRSSLLTVIQTDLYCQTNPHLVSRRSHCWTPPKSHT